MAEYNDTFPIEDFLLTDSEEIPCEFCDELFPFHLLMEHQSGCRPDLLHYNLEDVTPKLLTPVVAKKEPVKRLPVALIDLLDDDPEIIDESKDTAKAKPVNIPVIVSPKRTEQIDRKENIKLNTNTDKKKERASNPPSEEFKAHDIALTFEDPTMQETGTKLMSYGSNVNKTKKAEEEKPSFKVPSLPLLNNADQKEDDFNDFSDSEEGESLEDFWKRAEIKNSQRLKKISATY